MKQQVTEKVRKTIQQHHLIRRGDNVVAGVSGGPDSICLLHVLFCLKDTLQIKTLAAVHINHMYRGQEAEADQKYTQRFCERLDIPCFVYRKDVVALAGQWKMSTEEAGRKVRYDAFREVLDSLEGNGKIAVAHNFDDQAETILMRIIRGTGTDGLAGMEYMRENHIIRPLLDISRAEIEEYCRENRLEPVTDKTNLQPIYTRNIIRLELIPRVEEIFGGNFRQSLCSLGEIAAQDKSFIYQFVEQVLKEAYTEKTEQGQTVRMIFSKEALSRLHPAVRKRVFLKALANIGLTEGTGAVHLQQAERVLFSEKAVAVAQFPHQYCIKKSQDKIICEKVHDNDIWMPYDYEMKENDTVFLAEAGLVAECRVIEDFREVEKLKESWYTRQRGDMTQYFDKDKMHFPLRIRTRRGRELFSPLGFQGTKKLKAYFTEKKVKLEERGRLPLFCRGDTVLWIPGYGIHDQVKIDGDTRRVLRISLRSLGEKEKIENTDWLW